MIFVNIKSFFPEMCISLLNIQNQKDLDPALILTLELGVGRLNNVQIQPDSNKQCKKNEIKMIVQKLCNTFI